MSLQCLLSVVTALLCAPAASATPSPACAAAVQRAELELDRGDLARTEAAAHEAVVACARAKELLARAYLTLSTVRFHQDHHDEAMRWAQAALKAAPRTAAAQLRVCVLHVAEQDYDRAIARCRAGLKSPGALAAALNSNLGLAIYLKAAKEQQLARVVAAELPFSASRAQDPSLPMNYFFLGSIEEHQKLNPKAALELYQKGCELKDTRSCEALRQVDLSPGYESAGEEASTSPDEEDLCSTIEQQWIHNGMTKASATSAISALRERLRSGTSTQRVRFLRRTAEFGR